MLMQGAVNHLGHFTNVYVGWPGRVHDARVFANSALYVQGQEGRYPSPAMEQTNWCSSGRPCVPSSPMANEGISR